MSLAKNYGMIYRHTVEVDHVDESKGSYHAG
jgi:hypothetical protein